MASFRYKLVREPITKVEKREFEEEKEHLEQARNSSLMWERGREQTAEDYTELAIQQTLDLLGSKHGRGLTLEDVQQLTDLWYWPKLLLIEVETLGEEL